MRASSRDPVALMTVFGLATNRPLLRAFPSRTLPAGVGERPESEKIAWPIDRVLQRAAAAPVARRRDARRRGLHAGDATSGTGTPALIEPGTLSSATGSNRSGNHGSVRIEFSIKETPGKRPACRSIDHITLRAELLPATTCARQQVRRGPVRRRRLLGAQPLRSSRSSRRGPLGI